jgi:hypothetical protein
MSLPPAVTSDPFITATVTPTSNLAAVPLSSYFSDPQGAGPLTYWIASDVFGGASLSGPNADLLDIAWIDLFSSNDTTYTVSVGASNAAGLSISADAAIVDAATPTPPPPAPLPPAVTTDPFITATVTSTSNLAAVPLSNYFSDPQGAGSLTYWIAHDPHGGASLSGSNADLLDVAWIDLFSSNDTTYTVSVGASNAAGLSISADAAIVDAATPTPPPPAPLPPAVTTDPFITATVTSTSNLTAVALSNYFSDPQGAGPLTYWIAHDPYGGASLSGTAVDMLDDPMSTHTTSSRSAL